MRGKDKVRFRFNVPSQWLVVVRFTGLHKFYFYGLTNWIAVCAWGDRSERPVPSRKAMLGSGTVVGGDRCSLRSRGGCSRAKVVRGGSALSESRSLPIHRLDGQNAMWLCADRPDRPGPLGPYFAVLLRSRQKSNARQLQNALAGEGRVD